MTRPMARAGANWCTPDPDGGTLVPAAAVFLEPVKCRGCGSYPVTYEVWIMGAAVAGIVGYLLARKIQDDRA